MKFGTPSAKDATAEHEKEIKLFAEDRVAWLKEMDRILNRPLGSIVNQTAEEKIADYEFRMQHPDQVVQEAMQRAQVVGVARAQYELLKWDEEIRKLKEK